MPHSMTAFARRDRDTEWGVLVWELRTVNHRYLEISPRLPEELRLLEAPVRDLLHARLGRGKVDCTLRLQARAAAAAQLDLDEGIADRVLALGRRLSQGRGDLAPLRAIDVLRWPGVIKAPEVDLDALGRVALELLAQALGDLTATRAREGERLAELLRQRLGAIGRIVGEVQALLPQVVQGYRERLQARLAEVRAELEPGRLEQEIVLFAQKSDVAEELDRLATHVGEIERVLGQTGQVGRRLDFLMQELNREANTLGSKAADIRLTNAAVELKVLIEQMREQVQNIE